MQMKKMGMYKININEIENLPKVIEKYSYITKGNEEVVSTLTYNQNYLYLPRNKTKLNLLFENYSIKDKTISSKLNKQIETKFSLRDYQEELLNNLKGRLKNNQTDFLINAPTGSGKSFIVPFIIKLFNQKTLIIVDREFLLNQMVNEIENNSTHKVNIINKNTKTLSDINIVTNQLLNKNPQLIPLLNKEIGLVILDEAHVAGAKTIIKNIQSLYTKYRVGLTATPTRSDGLQEVLFDLFEHKLDVNYKTNVNISAILLKTKDLVDAKSYNKLVERLMENNETYLDTVIKYALKNNHQILVAINNKKWQNKIKNKYKNIAEVINSNTSKQGRESILKKYQEGKTKIIIGYGVLDKGISIPDMTLLIDYFSATTKEKIEQLIGRLNREHKDGKNKTYISFNAPYTLFNQYQIKLKTLSKLKNKLNLKVKQMNIETLVSKLI